MLDVHDGLALQHEQRGWPAYFWARITPAPAPVPILHGAPPRTRVTRDRLIDALNVRPPSLPSPQGFLARFGKDRVSWSGTARAVHVCTVTHRPLSSRSPRPTLPATNQLGPSAIAQSRRDMRGPHHTSLLWPCVTPEISGERSLCLSSSTMILFPSWTVAHRWILGDQMETIGGR